MIGYSSEACERDLQCGGGMCCAVSLWIRSLRMCTPLGNEGDDCHPLSHKSAGSGKGLDMWFEGEISVKDYPEASLWDWGEWAAIYCN
ncbi:unnamed protein product [Ranitomeya imitator]|uniref:Prokineticin domain-containing protein n=1 Tax=Ranitomeya imitator TaxID=111125 RepID=A0ABN9KWW2_9NEOB|nr:unnamed protein product [Ranitomeya imitator]